MGLIEKQSTEWYDGGHKLHLQLWFILWVINSNEVRMTPTSRASTPLFVLLTHKIWITRQIPATENIKFPRTHAHTHADAPFQPSLSLRPNNFCCFQNTTRSLERCLLQLFRGPMICHRRHVRVTQKQHSCSRSFSTARVSLPDNGVFFYDWTLRCFGAYISSVLQCLLWMASALTKLTKGLDFFVCSVSRICIWSPLTC